MIRHWPLWHCGSRTEAMLGGPARNSENSDKNNPAHRNHGASDNELPRTIHFSCPWETRC